jgi:cyclic nucleotide gated channel
MLVSVAVLYNFVFVIGRAVFWELNNSAPTLWWTLDYTCDIIYLLDTLIHAHEGKIKRPRRFHFCMLAVQAIKKK